jgi:hypothetical protein
MGEEVFRAVADKLLEASAQITLSGMGDPLLHPRWETMIRSLRYQGGTVGIQVSAAALDEETIARMVDAAPSFINLSVPSTRRETLARLLPGSDPSRINDTPRRLLDAVRGRIPVTIIGIRTALEDPGMARRFTRYWKERGLAARVADCHSRGGNLSDETLLAPSRRTGLQAPCGLLARHAFVTWQGELLACCHDLTGETVLGNLVRDELSTLVERKERVADRLPPFELCNRCDEPLRRLPLPEGLPPETSRETSRYLRSLGVAVR